jgi:hypothetical protein
MKTISQFFAVIVTGLLLSFSHDVVAQDAAASEPPTPQYYTVTTMHWNMDYEGFDEATWKAIEQEYMDNVTVKNEHILTASYYLHHTSPDNSELLYVQGYASWEAIDKASERDGELAQEHWADSTAGRTYFEKRNAYYANKHSDEIYRVTRGTKFFTEAPTDGMILYLRKNHAAFPDDGSGKEFRALLDAKLDMINKNEYIKAYFPSAHFYGADSTERIEAFFLNSLSDLEKMYARNDELRKEAIPDDAKRAANAARAAKYNTGHGDSFYTLVGGLLKNNN